MPSSRSAIDKPFFTPVLLGSLCALFWGGQAVAVKVALVELSVTEMLAVRFLLSGSFLWICFYLNKTRFFCWKDALGLIVGAILFITQITLFVIGTDRVTSIESTLLINVFPVFAAILAHFFLPGHRLSVPIAAGIGLAITGLFVCLLYTSPSPRDS